jgi:rhodanese-related sulfurtransferase
MPQTITRTAKDIVKEAMALVGSPDHVLVDLRDGAERAKAGVIDSAVTSSRGMMEFHTDPESPVHKPEFNQDKTYVFCCASAGRSAMATKVAMEMGLSPVIKLAGGVGAWKKVGDALV